MHVLAAAGDELRGSAGPGPRRTCGSAKSASIVFMALLRRRAPSVARIARGLLGDVDAHRAPGDAAPAADAAGGPELVDARWRACGSSTAGTASAVAAARLPPWSREWSTVKQESQRAPALGLARRPDRCASSTVGAEAGRADHGAVARRSGSGRRRRPSGGARGC